MRECQPCPHFTCRSARAESSGLSCPYSDFTRHVVDGKMARSASMPKSGRTVKVYVKYCSALFFPSVLGFLAVCFTSRYQSHADLTSTTVSALKGDPCVPTAPGRLMLGLEHFHFFPTILQGVSTVKQHAIVWQDGKGKRCFHRVHRAVKNIFALKPHLFRLMRQPQNDRFNKRRLALCPGEAKSVRARLDSCEGTQEPNRA